MRIRARTARRIALATAVYLAALWVMMRAPGFAPDGEAVAGLPLVPLVVILAFVFETLDSGAGMGFGTALSPLLLAMGYAPLAVVPVLLASEAMTGIVSGVFHQEFGNVRFRWGRRPNAPTRILLLTAGVGVVAIAVSIALAYFAVRIPAHVIEAYVGLLVVGMAVVALASPRLRSARRFRPRRLLAFAALAGINKGIGGGGYGPVLTLGEVLSGVEEKRAVAISSLAEGIVALVGFATFLLLSASASLPLGLLPSVFTGGFLASVISPYFVHLIPPAVYRYTLPAYAVVIGIVLLAGVSV